MSTSFANIWYDTIQRAAAQLASLLPPLMVAVAILLLTWAFARLTRWLLKRTFEGRAVDRFLTQSGIAHMFPQRRVWRSAPVVTDLVYIAVWIFGVLVALSVFDTFVTASIVSTAVVLIPKLFLAAVLIIACVWLGQYLSRTALVWAVNEDVPYPRRWAMAIRILVVSLGVVVAAETLQFAATVFLVTWLILLTGATVLCVLTLSKSKSTTQVERERGEAVGSLWNHL